MCLIVTHDPVEAVSLADRVLVLEEGRVVQYAEPGEVARHPRSPWVARMLGRNAWSGAVRDGGLEPVGAGWSPPPTRLRRTGRRRSRWSPPRRCPASGAPVRRQPAQRLAGHRAELTAHGARLRVLVADAPAPGLDVVAEVTPAAVAELRLAEGAEVWVSVKATEITVVPL